MRNLNYIFAMSILAIGIVSCSQDEQIIDVSKASNDVDPVVKTLNLVKNYENSSMTKSSSLSEIIIDNYEKTTYSFPLETISTRSTVTDIPESTSVDLYLINFHKGEDSGFAIASGDDRINRVYAYTECGDISDTTYIDPMACMIRSIPYVVKQDIQKYYSTIETKSAKAGTYVTYGPLLTTAWHQGDPYNYYAPSFNWTESNKKSFFAGRSAAGCTPIATSQVIAYYEKFTGTMFGNRNIDFKALKAESHVYPWSTQAQIVGNFIREVATKCNTNYDAKGNGGARVEAAYTYLKGMGYPCSVSIDANVNITSLYNNIKRGNPHITCGWRNKEDGHTWVWDGIRGYVNGSSFTVDAVHCNWGQGADATDPNHPNKNCNGWYVSYEQPDPALGSYYDDNVQLYITLK